MNGSGFRVQGLGAQVISMNGQFAVHTQSAPFMQVDETFWRSRDRLIDSEHRLLKLLGKPQALGP